MNGNVNMKNEKTLGNASHVNTNPPLKIAHINAKHVLDHYLILDDIVIFNCVYACHITSLTEKRDAITVRCNERYNETTIKAFLNGITQTATHGRQSVPNIQNVSTYIEL